ncbi:MAG: hypothetical protein KDF65_01620 [Anaerolineae bacterium]|nr:hypothetical protein [Anaerolineae bacterium]
MLQKFSDTLNQWRRGKQKVSRSEPVAFLAGSGLLFLLASRRSGLVQAGLMAGSGFLFYRGLRRYFRLDEQDEDKKLAELTSNRPNSRPIPINHTIDPTNKVDETLWETFPASDPPATY